MEPVRARSLEDLLAETGSAVELLRGLQTGAPVFPGVPAEYTNWRDEQRAWQTTCVLFNQSFHMNDLAVEGPDSLTLLSRLGVNSFEGFGPGKAKHFVACTPGGHVIGDVILFGLGESRFNLVDRVPVMNWIAYQAEAGGYDVALDLDVRSLLRSDGRRRSYRFQLQGPAAMDVIERALGVTPPELAFFHQTTVTIAGRTVHALRSWTGRPRCTRCISTTTFSWTATASGSRRGSGTARTRGRC